MKYPIAIEPGNDKHAFSVVVPDLPGCFSAGDTIDEAIVNAKEAIELWLETIIDDGGTTYQSQKRLLRTRPILNTLDGHGRPLQLI